MSSKKVSKKIDFSSRYFQKKEYREKTISRYFRNAFKDLKIAFENEEPEVIFRFSYSALVKIGITLIGFHGYRVMSRRGHHVRILKKLSEILGDEDIEIIGNKMRKKRNSDMYGAGVLISAKEAKDYREFVKAAVEETKKYLKSQHSLFDND